MTRLLVLAATALTGALTGVLAGPAQAAPRKLPAPWDKIDFRGTGEAAAKALGAKEPEAQCNFDALYVTDRVCWGYRDGYGDLRVEMFFPSIEVARKRLTDGWGPALYREGAKDGEDWIEYWQLTAGTRQILATLQPHGAGQARIDLDQLIPLATFLRAGPPDGIAKLLGRRPAEIAKQFGKRTECEGAPFSCMISFPPTEVGYTRVFVQFDKGIARKVHYATTCGTDCLTSLAYKTYVAALGAPTVKTTDGSTHVTFAKGRGIRFEIRESFPAMALVCLGACTEPTHAASR